MNVLLCSINTLKGFYDIAGVEVGQHFYWKIVGFQVHAQVLITSWVVIAILLGSSIVAIRNPQTIPTDGQNFFEYVLAKRSAEAVGCKNASVGERSALEGSTRASGGGRSGSENVGLSNANIFLLSFFSTLYPCTRNTKRISVQTKTKKS